MKITENLEVALSESKAVGDEVRFHLREVGRRAEELQDPDLFRALGYLSLSLAELFRSNARVLEAAEEANP